MNKNKEISKNKILGIMKYIDNVNKGKISIAEKKLTNYQKHKKYFKKYNKYYYLKKILSDPDYNKKLNQKRKLKKLKITS